MEDEAWMAHTEPVLGDQPVKVQLDIAQRRDLLGAGRPPGLGIALEDWSL